MTRPFLFLVALVAIGGVYFFAFCSVGSREPRLEGKTSIDASVGTAEAKPARAARREAPANRPEHQPLEVVPPPEAQTSREFLSEYWGERWPEIEAAIEAANYDIDRPFEFVPWEEARHKLEPFTILSEKQLKAQAIAATGWYSNAWSDYGSFSGWIRGEYQFHRDLDEHELAGVEDACRSLNKELQDLGDLFADQIQRHVSDRWARSDFVKAPITTYGVSNEKGFYSKSAAGAGWSIVITLKREECPDAMETLEHSRALRRERDQALLAYLRTLPR